MPELTPIDPKDLPQRQRGKRAINPNRVPKWAHDLAVDVCAFYDKPMPPIRWRVSRQGNILSSGATFWNRNSSPVVNLRISMTVGADMIDQRLTLLHELAHWTMPAKEGHTYRYWERAWAIFQHWAPEDLDAAYERSKTYKKKAVIAAPKEVYERNEGIVSGSFTVEMTEQGMAALEGEA